MKVNAPEKLYLSKNIYSTYLYQVPDPDDDTAIEYTRTDAFIKKACEWLKNFAYFYVNDLTGSLDEIRLIEDFKKALEE